MNIGKFILDAAKSRIVMLKREIALIDEQLSVVSTSPGVTLNQHTQLFLERNIKTAEHEVFLQYYNAMSQISNNVFQLHQAVTNHLFIMRLPAMHVLLQKLYGHRLAIATFMAPELPNIERQSIDSDDVSLLFLYTVFPYEISVSLLSDQKFFTSLLKIVIDYDPRKHKSAFENMFNLVKKFLTAHPISDKSIYFKFKIPLYFILAEQFLTSFTSKTMMKHTSDPIRNYIVSEKCMIIAENGTQICQLNPKLVERIQTYSTQNNNQNNKANIRDIHLYPIDSISATSSSSESSDNETDYEILSIPELRFVVYEIRKLPLMTSPTTMTIVLSNAIEYLQKCLTTDGNLIGADETFQFFVYALSSAKLHCLPNIINFITGYIDDDLSETKFAYNIEQLRSSLDFINRQSLPTRPYIILPFSKPPPDLKDSLIRVKSDPIYLKGFNVYAFPLWRNDPKFLFPALFHYTGCQEKAVGYQYVLASNVQLDYSTLPKCEAIPTTNGTFLQLSESYIQANSMIRIDGGDYDAAQDDLEIVSSMVLMCQLTNTSFNTFSSYDSNGNTLKGISTSMKDHIYNSIMKGQWRMRSHKADNAVREAVAEVQRSLMLLGFLPPSFPMNGVLDYNTLSAISTFINAKSNKVAINPRVFNYIISCGAKKTASQI
ncbi:hypothetical protein TRFO_31827 [Tritrichomonas foetus]|uniref:VPS9 domain-containing protein n=1 Tax=Tritrichomonas foetus TaxID=1144522 RepID=A0A1J4JQJ9_9EUKA|nr:hypothetical protein TRFO_31827 [Tritrichomonas foetus]|eukprot:OHT01393.1 hypothetical protein TRFO_31827 [Tritrichomonas foetus]